MMVFFCQEKSCEWMQTVVRGTDDHKTLETHVFRSIMRDNQAELHKKTPLLAGSFTDWKVHKMVPIEEFARQISQSQSSRDIPLS